MYASESLLLEEYSFAIERITAEKVQLDDVIINEEEKENVINAIDAFLNSKESKDYRKGFILTEPPGTGKTQLVKALANEKNCYFMAPKLSDLKGEYVGQTSGKVKRIFDEARIFFFFFIDDHIIQLNFFCSDSFYGNFKIYAINTLF